MTSTTTTSSLSLSFDTSVTSSSSSSSTTSSTTPGLSIKLPDVVVAGNSASAEDDSMRATDATPVSMSSDDLPTVANTTGADRSAQTANADDHNTQPSDTTTTSSSSSSSSQDVDGAGVSGVAAERLSVVCFRLVSSIFNVQIQNETVFTNYLVHTFKIAQLPLPVVMLGLKYLHSFRMSFVGDPAARESFPLAYTSPALLFTSCLILANDFLDDKAYTLKTWSEITGLPVATLFGAQFAVMQQLKFRLMVSDVDYSSWLQTVRSCIQRWHTPPPPAAHLATSSSLFSLHLPGGPVTIERGHSVHQQAILRRTLYHPYARPEPFNHSNHSANIASSRAPSATHHFHPMHRRPSAFGGVAARRRQH